MAELTVKQLCAAMDLWAEKVKVGPDRGMLSWSVILEGDDSCVLYYEIALRDENENDEQKLFSALFPTAYEKVFSTTEELMAYFDAADDLVPGHPENAA